MNRCDNNHIAIMWDAGNDIECPLCATISKYDNFVKELLNKQERLHVIIEQLRNK